MVAPGYGRTIDAEERNLLWAMLNCVFFRNDFLVRTEMNPIFTIFFNENFLAFVAFVIARILLPKIQRYKL